MAHAALTVYREAGPPEAAADTALSRALLEEVAGRRSGPTLRLYRAHDALAFSIADRTRPGFAEAVEHARSLGFEPIVRLAGGRAAVFTRETLAFAWAVPEEDARSGIRARFDTLATLVVRALRGLGVDARLGEVPGEYCPGSHSVNARGRTKLMGVGQRVIRGGAHIGGVIPIARPERLTEALVPVYAALGYPFDPGSVGAVASELPGTDLEQVAEALLGEFAAHCGSVEERTFDPALLEAAAAAARRYRPDTSAPPGHEEPTARAMRKIITEASNP